MLKAKVIPKLLEQIHVDGIESTLLMLDDGALLGSAGSISSSRTGNGQVIAAILSNVWADYERIGRRIEGAGDVKVILLECEAGRVGTIRLGGRYIAAACGEDVATDVLKANLRRLYASLDPILRSITMIDD